MTAYPYAERIDPTIRSQIAVRLEAANSDWESGRATSPDTLDFVNFADQILSKRLGDKYIGSTVEGRQLIADAMWEIQCEGGRLQEWGDMADYLVDQLVAE